jgi:hypothetical protein
MPAYPYTIAVSGKGGTGKTTVSSLLIRALIDAQEIPVLAVDADPNANLHEALGVEIHETLGSMREEAFTRNIPPGMNRHDYVRYRFRQALVEEDLADAFRDGRGAGVVDGHRRAAHLAQTIHQAFGLGALAGAFRPVEHDAVRSETADQQTRFAVRELLPGHGQPLTDQRGMIAPVQVIRRW